MAHQFKTQVASDIGRDGLGVELISESGDVVAEVFRSDRDHTLILNTFSYDVPLEAIDVLISIAHKELEPFEDGSSLDSAKLLAARKTAAGRASSD